MQLGKVDYSLKTLLTPHNYFEWKPNILLLLKKRGLYQITMAIEVNLDSTNEKNNFSTEKTWISYLSACLFLLNYNIM
jgi:hypothetical protein